MNPFQSFPPVIAPSDNPIAQTAPPTLTKGGKVKKPSSRPASRAATKRPRKPKASATPAIGGNTSGYEECTDGDDGPAPKKRAKTTKATEWNQKNPFGTGPESLRVAASTAGSLRLFRPIAMNQNGQPGSHMQEIPRAPTPVPRLPQNMLHQPGQSGLRRDSFAQESTDPTSRVNSPYATMSQQDDLRVSIESAGPSPGRQDSPADSPAGETPHEFNSSPPVMRTRPPSIRSSPPCPTSPCLPQMPRTDSGFMSGSMEELFGDDHQELYLIDDEDEVDMVNAPEKPASRQPSIARTEQVQQVFRPEYPGPVEALPTRMPILEPAKASKAKALKSKTASKSARSRGGSLISEDGTQSLPPLRTGNQQVLSGLSILQQPQNIRGLSQESTGNSPYPFQSGLQVSSVSPYATMQQQSQNMDQAPVPSPYEMVLQQFSNPQQPFAPTPFPQPQQSTTPRPQTPHLPPQSPAVIQGHQPSQFPPQQSQIPRTMSQQPPLHLPSQPSNAPQEQAKGQTPIPQVEAQGGPAGIAPPPEPRRTMNRTSSLGALTLPQIPASDPVLPPSSLQRSQTWSEAPHAMTEGPMPMMDDMQQVGQGPAPRKDRSWNAKKAAIKQRLEQAIARGEMPPFCCNCGSIDTPTWRKSWSRECQGAPGYYEYSDEPGRVTSIVILTRDLQGTPTSFQLIKKSLNQDDVFADYKEFTLCNRKSSPRAFRSTLTILACGIWMSKYKTQRPPERWENSNIPIVKKVPEKKQPKPRVRGPRNKSAGSEPPVEFSYQAPTDGPSPTDMANMQQRDTSQEPTKRLNAMTSDAASAALRRAIQSSPARWVGTRHSPISLEVDEPSRRLLFPSPRKDGSPKILGDTITNVVQFPENYDKNHLEASNKENCPPMNVDHEDDDEFLKMFEEEMARPTTPVQKEIPENLFKTPNRPTPRGRGANGSASRSGQKSSGNMLHLTPTRRTPRRSPRNHNTEMPRRSPRHIEQEFMSPFTASLNRIMSAGNDHAQANSSPSRHGMGIDFENLPDLPLQNHNNNFSLEDFFSTDVPMPSSPPRAFRLYEDPISLNNINWDEFNKYNEQNLGDGAPEEEVMIKDEPQEELQKGLGDETSEQDSA